MAQFVLARYERRGRGEYLDVTDLASAAGVHPDLVDRLYCLGIIEAVEPERSPRRFAPNEASRLRRMVRLHHDLGLAWSSLGLTLDLLERIEMLETRIRTLETS